MVKLLTDPSHPRMTQHYLFDLTTINMSVRVPSPWMKKKINFGITWGFNLKIDL